MWNRSTPASPCTNRPSVADHARGTRTRAPSIVSTPLSSLAQRRTCADGSRTRSARRLRIAGAEHLENQCRQRHTIRIVVLRDRRRNCPQPLTRSTSCHRIRHTSPLRWAVISIDDERVVQRLREPRQRLAVRVLRVALMQGRPELAQLVSRKHSFTALVVGRLYDSQRRVGLDPIALDREAE